MTTPVTIYLDMDDVVADWQGYVEEMLEHKFAKDERLPEGKWRRLKDNQRLYSQLPIRKGAHALVKWVTEYANDTGGQVCFLSAIPKGNDMPWAPQDKVYWADRHFPHIPVFLGPYANQKYMHCRNPGDILIDDRGSNCEEWIAAGGRAHQYKEWPECKAWLEKTLGVNMGEEFDVLKKKYDGESIVDLDRDISEMLDEEFDPRVALIPKDANGFHKGTFEVTVRWVP